MNISPVQFGAIRIIKGSEEKLDQFVDAEISRSPFALIVPISTADDEVVLLDKRDAIDFLNKNTMLNLSEELADIASEHEAKTLIQKQPQPILKRHRVYTTK